MVVYWLPPITQRYGCRCSPMIEHAAIVDSNEVLVVDSNYTRGHSFLAVLNFINVEARLIAPEQLAAIQRRELYNYLAIFSIGSDDITQFFGERNRQDNCKYPLVLLVDKSDFNLFEIILQPPYISGLCFQSDYYAQSARSGKP